MKMRNNNNLKKKTGLEHYLAGVCIVDEVRELGHTQDELRVTQV